MEVFGIALVVGVLVGILSGILGIGGGTVMVPVFRLGFAMTAIQATATSLFTIIPTSLAGCIMHIRNRTCVIPLGLAAGIGGAFTSPLGVWLASVSPSWTIMLVAALVIGYSAFTMLRKAWAMKSGANNPSKAESLSAETISMDRKQLLIGAGIGFIAGVISGYVGVGGGFIMVPLFVSILAVPMKKASGTSLIAIIILCTPGAIEQMIMGNVQVVAGLALALGSIPGALVGAQLLKYISERRLRLMFGVLLLVVAVMMAVNEFVPFGA